MATNIRDKNLSVSKALPAAAATNYSDGIDLIDSAPGIKMRGAEYEISAPATPALVDDKTITLTPQDSADGVTYADIPSLAPLVITGAGGVGAAATVRAYKLPQTVRRYVRTKQVVLTGGGSNIAVSVTSSIIF